MSASTATPALTRREVLLWSCALWIGTCALYFKILGFDFIKMDTKPILLDHGILYDSRSLLASLRQILFQYFPREEPLIVRDITWAIEARAFGLRSALGHHLGQLVFNATNTVLAFAFLLRSTKRPRVALGCAALFAVLPVHVSPVCWDMGRKDLLVAGFMLFGLYLQCISLERTGTRSARNIDALIWVVTLCALLSKFSAIVYAPILALHRVLQPYLDGSAAPDAPLAPRAAAKRAAPILMPTLAISAVVYYWYNLNLTQFGVLVGRGPAALSLEHLHTLSRLLPLSLALDLKLIVWPFDYSIYYLLPNANILPSWWEVAISYAVCFAYAGVTLWACKRRKDVAFFLIAAAVMMVPYLNIQFIGIWIADRYVYSSALFLLGALAMAIPRDAQPPARLRAAAGVAFAALIAVCAARTSAHADHYHDDLTLWSYEVERARPSPMAFEALAREFVERAKHAAPGRERTRLADQARKVITRGLAYYEALPLRTSSYRPPERLLASTMHRFRGELALLEGAPGNVALAHLRKAHLLAKTGLSALLLAQAAMQVAGEDAPERRDAWVRLSFAYFAEYAESAGRDVAQRSTALDMLAVNYSRFRFLEHDVRELENTLR